MEAECHHINTENRMIQSPPFVGRTLLLIGKKQIVIVSATVLELWALLLYMSLLVGINIRLNIF